MKGNICQTSCTMVWIWYFFPNQRIVPLWQGHRQWLRPQLGNILTTYLFSRLDDSVKDPSLPKSPPMQIGVVGWVVIGQHYRMFSTFLVRTLQFGSWQCCTTAILDGCSSLCRFWAKQESPVDSTSFKLTFSSIGRKSLAAKSTQIIYFHSWEGKKVQ